MALADGDIFGIDSAVLRDQYRLALARYADGLIDGATRLTAGHVSTREQFGKPIALFQAVSQQLADIYVIGRGMELATTAAGWRLSQGLDAGRDLTIATYWLAAEILATMRTMTHLHGGIGVDLTYPLHRYFSVAKDLARLVGGAAANSMSWFHRRCAQCGSGTRGYDDARRSHARAICPAWRNAFVLHGLVSADDAREMLTDRHGPAYRRIIKRMGTDERPVSAGRRSMAARVSARSNSRSSPMRLCEPMSRCHR